METMIRINSDRFLADFEELAAVGATGDGGVNRPALSPAHLEARAWLQSKIKAAGLTFSVDAAGNHSGLLHCGMDSSRRLLIGSHLDSVPNGGRFDGALGVVTALEVLRTIKEAGIRLSCDLELIDFTDEEGTLVGLLGSRALAGSLPQSDLDAPRGGRDALEAGFMRAGITDPRTAARSPEALAGYLEVHIEQSERLSEDGADIGIVQSLVGIVSYELAFRGRADHAGTTPMDRRSDAGLAAATFMMAATDLVVRKYPESVVNFGRSTFSPGAYNIVPEKAVLALEFRSPDQAQLDTLEKDLVALADETARRFKVGLDKRRQGCVAPAPCAQEVRSAFAIAAENLGLRAIEMVSGAGHDTQAMASVCPAGMVFIPSTGGSHNPSEFATVEACENGANVILHAVLSGWG